MNAARLLTQTTIDEGKNKFGYFNGIAAYTAPELPWKNIQKLATEFMSGAEDARQTEERANEVLPAKLRAGEAHVTFRPAVIVEQASENASVTSERILREVHWSVKGVPRREYRSELIEVSPETGLHRVKSVGTPVYIQGPGGIGQVFQHLAETRASTR